jgi:sugar/nucleoside kinase (ribokinase family)
MGLKVAIYTSGATHLDLEPMAGIEILDQPSPRTTTFVNTYTPSGRVQRLLHVAKELDYNQIPEGWKKAKIIHLGPVAGEVPIEVRQEFTDGFLVYSLQGWMRAWDQEGHIFPSSLPELKSPIQENAVGILSIEDLGNDRSGLNELQDQFPTLILTLGSQGVEIYAGGQSTHIRTSETTEIDPTGAGDIFAAAFVILWQIKGLSLTQAARGANLLAATSVKKSGLAGIPEIWEINEIIGVQE